MEKEAVSQDESAKVEMLLQDAKKAVRSQRRRLAEVRAREHVGAAGWAQSAVLESILSAGHEGLSATDSLRQVVSLTTEHIRSLPLTEMSQQSQEHVGALNSIVQSGEEQVTAAQALEELICQALDEIAATPLDEVSVQRLKRIHGHVQQQVNALNTIIEAAKAQADTIEQVAALEQVSAEHYQRVNQIRQLSAEEEVSALSSAGQEIVSRITEIAEAHPQQLEALQQIGEAIVEKMPDTGAPPDDQADTLEQIAEAAQAKADKLRKD